MSIQGKVLSKSLDLLRLNYAKIAGTASASAAANWTRFMAMSGVKKSIAAMSVLTGGGLASYYAFSDEELANISSKDFVEKVLSSPEWKMTCDPKLFQHEEKVLQRFTEIFNLYNEEEIAEAISIIRYIANCNPSGLHLCGKSYALGSLAADYLVLSSRATRLQQAQKNGGTGASEGHDITPAEYARELREKQALEREKRKAAGGKGGQKPQVIDLRKKTKPGGAGGLDDGISDEVVVDAKETFVKLTGQVSQSYAYHYATALLIAVQGDLNDPDLNDIMPAMQKLYVEGFQKNVSEGIFAKDSKRPRLSKGTAIYPKTIVDVVYPEDFSQHGVKQNNAHDFNKAHRKELLILVGDLNAALK